mgnify:CR=1 FL=1|tara:strand:+ start:317 stop:841 length:525 start_codon:yes stop_codon:yes gene_type:complete
MKSISDDFEIYKYKISNWQEKKYKLIELFHKTKPIIFGNVLTNFNNSPENRDLIIKEIIRLFYDEIINFKKYIGSEYILESAWIQEYHKNMNHELHNHGTGYSSVIYINFDKEVHSSTMFVDKVKRKSFLPEVEEGDIIFFNSKHYHHCPTNKSDIKRMICSFNLKKKGLIYYT